MNIFRAWDTVEKEWVSEKVRIYSDGTIEIDTGREFVTPADPDRIKISWRIGIFSNVGFFEGDVLECVDTDEEKYIATLKKHGTIEVRGGEFDYTLLQWAEDFIQDFKKIGNIFENPELDR